MKKTLPSLTLVLDVGTTTIKAFLFDAAFRVVGRVSEEIQKTHPKRGWVEQDPETYLRVSRNVLRKVVREAGVDPHACLCFGLTNQRETVIAWDSQTGEPVYPAIVWEDVRTARSCIALKKKFGRLVREKTGLALDPYFSATKIMWLQKNIPAMRTLADAGRLRIGTVDSWLLWHLCEGHPHVTDETNASRTLLYNIHAREWDSGLLKKFGIAESLLPTVRPSRSGFGFLDARLFGVRIPVLAVCGDQQSSFHASMRELGWEKGSHTKVTFGTGTFIMQTIGRTFKTRDPFFTTIVPAAHGLMYAVEAKINRGGKQVEPLLRKPVALRAFLRELALDVETYLKQLPIRPKEIAIDGGVSRDGIIGSFQSEISHVSVHTLSVFDGTALGTAYLCQETLRNSFD